jgi:DNA phosphorothioation-dependent restriction protein DptG
LRDFNNCNPTQEPLFYITSPQTLHQLKTQVFTVQNAELKYDKANDLCLSIHSYKEEITMKTAQYTKSLTVSLRPEVFDQIKQITDDGKISIGQWVREAVDAAIAKIEQYEDSHH